MPSTQMLEAHERRLGDVESVQGDFAVEMAHAHKDLEYLREEVGEIRSGQEKILEAVNAGRKETTDAVASLLERLNPLEEDRKAKIARWGVWKGRLAAPIVLVAGGVLGGLATKFGDMVWAWVMG